MSVTTRQGRRRRAAGAIAAAGLGLGVLAGCGDDETAEVRAPLQNQPAEEPDAAPFAGLPVTVSADVARVLGPQAFTLSGPEGELLVITRQPVANVNENAPVAVTGTVRRAFELLRVENEFGFNFDDRLFAVFDREPYILATAVDPTVGAGGTTTEQPTPTTTTEAPTTTTEQPTPTTTGQPTPTS